MPFNKGQSGNPGRRARGYQEFAQACRDVSHKGVKQVLEIAENKKNHPLVRVAAWKALWERGYGKAVQPVALGLEALGGKQQFVIRLPSVTKNSAAWEAQVERERVILDVETKELVSAVPGAPRKRQEAAE
jgi:hypothetical protein